MMSMKMSAMMRTLIMVMIIKPRVGGGVGGACIVTCKKGVMGYPSYNAPAHDKGIVVFINIDRKSQLLLNRLGIFLLCIECVVGN